VWSVSVFGQVNWVGPMPGSRPTWYLTHEYVGRNLACDLQELQVAPLTVPLFLEGLDIDLAFDVDDLEAVLVVVSQLQIHASSSATHSDISASSPGGWAGVARAGA